MRGPARSAAIARPFERPLTPNPSPARGEGGVGALLASAYPDRIAMARGKRGEFLMANGRAAALEAHDALAAEPFLAIGEIAGRAASARILLAAPLSLDDIEAVAGASIETADELMFDRASASLRARRRRRLGALVLAEQTLAVAAGRDGGACLGARRPFPWAFSACRGPRPSSNGATASCSCAAPKATHGRTCRTRRWRATPGGSRHFSWAKRGSTRSAPTTSPRRSARLFRGSWRAASTTRRRPTSVAPTGTAAPIDYESEGGPTIALKVQELFGLKEHPSLAGGRIPLTLQLLSPAHRPIQITRDLPGFWRGSWSAVRADLRGRYPRHFWPEDPAQAAPTARAKPRGT